MKHSFLFTLLFFSFCLYSVQPDRPDGLVAHWSFESADNGELADISGNGHNGIIQGNPKIVKGINGNAFLFESPEDKIIVENSKSFNFRNEMTLELWVNINGSGRFFQRMKSYNLNLSLLSGQLNLFSNKNWLFLPIAKKISFEKGKWYHIALVFDKTGYRTYINGIQCEIPTEKLISDKLTDPVYPLYPPLSIESTSRLFIGGSDTGIPPDKETRGAIDEFRIWSRALSEKEIKSEVDKFLQK